MNFYKISKFSLKISLRLCLNQTYEMSLKYQISCLCCSSSLNEQIYKTSNMLSQILFFSIQIKKKIFRERTEIKSYKTKP